MKKIKAEDAIKEFAMLMWAKKYDVFNEETSVTILKPCTIPSQIKGVDRQHFELQLHVPHGNFTISQYFGQYFGVSPEKDEPVLCFNNLDDLDEISKYEVNMINDIMNDFPMFCKKLISSIYYDKEDGEWYADEHFMKWIDSLKKGKKYESGDEWINEVLNYDDDITKRIEFKILNYGYGYDVTKKNRI